MCHDGAMPRAPLLAMLACALPAQAPGERFVLTPQCQLFVPAHQPRAGVPLDVVVHMHGDHRLAQDAFFPLWQRAVLLSVHISGFSSVYTSYFSDRQALQRLLDHAEALMHTRRPHDGRALTDDLALTAFSAGYAGVREILATPAYRARVRAVVLGDGLHTSYVNGNQVYPAQMVDFVDFARSASNGAVDFRCSHSAIVPGTYASTTQCADYLIAALASSRAPWPGNNLLGMTQTSRCERARFAVHGFAGTQASDHTLHFRYLWWMLADTRIGSGTGAVLPLVDRFTPQGKEQPAWQHKFAPHRVLAVLPAAPGGDGFALVVKDPAGGYDSARLGPCTLADYAVQAQLWCDYRPQLASNGFERVGVFARDDGNGGFEGSTAGGGTCYALAWDSHDGAVRFLRVLRGVVTELAAPARLPSTAWRTFRIEAYGQTLRFLVDGSLLAKASDAVSTRGQAGIGHHEFFTDNGLAQGTRAESLRVEK
jgi:hypothetical protein